MLASNVDLEEAFLVAKHAVELALKDGTGWMSTIERKPGDTYQAYYISTALMTLLKWQNKHETAMALKPILKTL